MPSSQLFRESLIRFKREAETRYKRTRDKGMLHSFPPLEMGFDSVQELTGIRGMVGEAGKKFSGEWTERVMANIGHIITIGNHATTGAPESVGLAWFAVKLTLSAIQSNYELHSFFGTALERITDIMIIVPHYDCLYDEQSKAHGRLKAHEWKTNKLVEKLFEDIRRTYTAVLHFCYGIKRYLGAKTLDKAVHVFKDLLGESKADFARDMAVIVDLKAAILEGSEALFQDEALDQMDAIKSIVGRIESEMSGMIDIQEMLREMNREQAAQFTRVLEAMEEIKSTTKPKTGWDIANERFEKNIEILHPQESATDGLESARVHRHEDTCLWIFQCSEYEQWHRSTTNGILYIHGPANSGKTTVIATVWERLESERAAKTILLHMSCRSSRGGTTVETLSVDSVCNTLLYLLYESARHDENNVKLLEDCNKVFEIPEKKLKARSSAIGNIDSSERLPEFADAFITVAALLDFHIVVALDDTDYLLVNERLELLKRVRSILVQSQARNLGHRSIKFLVGCRSISREDFKPTWSTDVGEYNNKDMTKMLEHALESIPNLTQIEQSEAVEAILKKASSQFAYVREIAIPFMREPFQRPLSHRLQYLPEGMEGVYHDALRKMSRNYIELLKTALLWSLLAPVPLRLTEIMDAHQGIYQERGLHVESDSDTLEHGRFPKSSIVEIEQLQGACGPFLKLELQPGSDEYLVHLQQPSQIHKFFMPESIAGPHNVEEKSNLCTRCESAKVATTTLTVSPKLGHLQLALQCMRAMNNAVFRKRSTKNNGTPLWNQLSHLIDDPEENVTSNEGREPLLNQSRPLTNIPEGRVIPKEVEDSNSEIDEAFSLTTSSRLRIPSISRVTENSARIGSTSMQVQLRVPKRTRPSEVRPARTKIPKMSDSHKSTRPGIGSDIVYISQERAKNPDLRMYRYEMGFWYYHILEAEALWKPAERATSTIWAALFAELDFWVNENVDWFRRWQLWDPTLATYRGYLNPLHVAAYLGLTSWVEHLLRKGTPVDETTDMVLKTPLQVAADKAHSHDMLEVLLDNGADPNKSINSTPAFQKWLIKCSKLKDIQLMLKSRGDPMLVHRDTGWTALHSFAWQGEDAAALDLLLKPTMNGAEPDINVRDKKWNTPLHVLLWRREVPKALLRAFLKHKANVNAENRDSVRPLQMACMYGDLATLETLWLSGIDDIDDVDNEGDTALQQAAIGNYFDCMTFLVDKKADPNVPNSAGKVALHKVATYGNKECLRMLLDHGATPNTADENSQTPLFCACSEAPTEGNADLLVDWLLKSDLPLSKINLPTTDRRTPLGEAAARGFESVVQKLVQRAEASDEIDSLLLNQRDACEGMTPLHRAASLGQTGCVRRLLTSTANVALCNYDKKTALTLAYEQHTLLGIQKAFEDTISLLIYADPKAAIDDPELVAACATIGSVRLLKQLSAIGADLNRQDKYGWSPMELARNHQQEDASRFLERRAAQWAKDARTQIMGNGTTIVHSSGNRLCISTIKPLLAGLKSFYFEITLVSSTGSEDTYSRTRFPVVAIGFCTIGGSAITFPGWPPRASAPNAQSWGYHGNDGRLFASCREDGSEVAIEMPYRTGHTIGCGVDLSTQTIWFTRDGRRLVTEFPNVQGRLFPLLGLEDKIIVRTNFTGPFKWCEGD